MLNAASPIFKEDSAPYKGLLFRRRTKKSAVPNQVSLHARKAAIYKDLLLTEVTGRSTGCFNTLRPPPSTAKLGNGTYENYIFSESYINSRLPCKFSEL